MNKTKLEELISQRLSTYAIASVMKCSQPVVRYWLKKHNLKTNPLWNVLRNDKAREIESGFKTCPQCQEKKELIKDNFYLRPDGYFHGWCKKCNDKITYEKQKQRKIDAVNYKGGKCQLCGYNKYVGSLDFHHLIPSKKEFAISRLRTYTWKKLQHELDKCICVCKNCHSEIHGGVIEIGGLTGNRTQI